MSTTTITPSANYGPSKWIVSPTLGQGTHTTIAAALASASSGDTITVRDGTYVEDLTGKAGVTISTITDGGSQQGNVVIQGNLTYTATGTMILHGISLVSNGGSVITMTGTNTSTLTLDECYVAINSTNGIVISNPNATLDVRYSNVNTSNGVVTFAVSAGLLASFWSSWGVSDTAATVSGSGAFEIGFSQIQLPVTTSGTSQLYVYKTQWGSSGAFNRTWITCGGTGALNRADHSSFYSGTASCISVSSGATFTVSECEFASSNTNIITGLGTVNYSSWSADNSGGNNASTINAQYFNAGNSRLASLRLPLTGVLTGNGSSSNVTASAITQHNVLVAGASNAITSIAPSTAGFVLTSNGPSADPTFQAAGGGGSITISGDSGSISGSSLTIYANNAINNCGSTVSFFNSSTTSTLNVTSGANTIIGASAGNLTPSTAIATTTALGSGAVGVANNISQTTAIGAAALGSIDSGSGNCAIGGGSLGSQTSGDSNTACGQGAGGTVLTGSYNTYVGNSSGFNHAGAETSNIYIGALLGGVASENNVIRIGDATQSLGAAASCYIGGIDGVTVTGAAVLCSTSGQLGNVSSSIRFKENISSLDDASARLMQCEPVQFNYKSDPDQNICYGMIAEEVEKIVPELVLYKDEQPYSLKYHEMPALLLNEIKKLRQELDQLKKQVS